LNGALINEQCSLSTVLESRFAVRGDDLVLEIFCARSEQLSIFMDCSDNDCEADPNELLSRARGRWAIALNKAFVKEETIRQELAGLATAATRLKADEDGALVPLLGPDEIGPALNCQVPADAAHAVQGGNEFDLSSDSTHSPPVWEPMCTIRARPELAKKGIDLSLIYAPPPSGQKGSRFDRRHK
jgi:hypothetical protein